MTEEVQHAVVDETDAPAEPVAEVASAREEPSIDDLLKDYETKVKPAETQPEQKADDTQKQIRELREEFRRSQIQGQVDDLVGKLHADTGVDPDFILGYLNVKASRDQKLSDAYFSASQQEKAKLTEAFARDILKKLSTLSVDKAATEDRAAVTAAVRGASTKAPVEKPIDFSQMSDAEVRKTMKEKYGYTPNF